MKGKIRLASSVLVLMLLCLGSSAQAGQWRFPVGFAYSGGAHDVAGVFKDNLRYLYPTAEEDSSEWPVGITFQPYYQFDSGVGIGGGFGPFMYLRAEVTGAADESYSMYAMPVNLCLRYAILPKSTISPYVRAGVSYHIAGGDWVKSKDVGFVGGIGVEFFRNRMVGAGIEVAYDSSSITLEKLPASEEKVQPNKLWVAIFAVF